MAAASMQLIDNIAFLIYVLFMRWKVVTLNSEVDKELESLDASFKAKFLHIANMLELFGPEHVKEPYCKPLGNKLWEIKMKSQVGIARAIYVTLKNKKIVILHAFVKKTQKIPKNAISTALKRLKEAKLT